MLDRSRFGEQGPRARLAVFSQLEFVSLRLRCALNLSFVLSCIPVPKPASRSGPPLFAHFEKSAVFVLDDAGLQPTRTHREGRFARGRRGASSYLHTAIYLALHLIMNWI